MECLSDIMSLIASPLLSLILVDFFRLQIGTNVQMLGCMRTSSTHNLSSKALQVLNPASPGRSLALLSTSVMLNSLFSFEEHSCSPTYEPPGFGYESARKPAQIFSSEDTGNGGVGAMDDLCSSYGYYPVPNNQQQFSQDFMVIDDPNFHAAISNAAQVTELSDFFSPKEKPTLSSFPSFDAEVLIRTESSGNGLSSEEAMRIAAAHFIQLSSPKDGDPSMQRLLVGISLSSLTTDEIKNVELASYLLAAAEKVTNQQYERASNLLRQCNMMSSTTGNPVKRVVYYFSDALQERIERETGQRSLKASKTGAAMTPEEVIKVMLDGHPLQLVCHKALPFPQITQFTSIQAIIDNVSDANRIHIIGLSIKYGLEWTILMQALANRPTCPVESLKISVVTVAKDVAAATGNRLCSFAESLGLPLEFKAVVVPDMKDLTETMFDLTEGEAVGLYACMDMNSMIVRPESLENLMRVIWKIKPCVMTVIDVEAKHNSSSFINRFTEALFYFSALFDCVDSMMERRDESRLELEGSFFSQGIKSIVATEGEERVVRHVGISVWREFFSRFGLVEADLNEYSTYQASLLLKQFVHGDSCTLEKDGKSLLIGWKGTPLYFVSAWKFKRREGKT